MKTDFGCKVSCTYCKNNTALDRINGRVMCEYNMEGRCNIFLPSQFEPVEFHEQMLIDRKIEEQKKAKKSFHLNSTFFILYYVGFLLLATIVGMTALYFRFTHPELTETQLLIEHLRRYTILDGITLAYFISAIIITKR